MPVWLNTAKSYVGQKEYPGAPSNPTIMRWAKKVAKFLGVSYAGDHVPWCGLFVSFCMVENGINPPAVSIRASEWAKWGQPLREPIMGAVLVFTREGGGHVGFFVGHDDLCYHVLGGNQSDAVSVTKIAKARCSAIRWPTGVRIEGRLPPKFALAGAVSTNEA